MGEPRRPPRREDIWIQILRDTDLEGAPARSEGLELIETTDPARFLEVGWAELLFVNDFFVRILLRAEADPAFVTGWTRHSGASGNGTVLLFRRITEVSKEWLRRIDAVARHHRSAGTRPSSAASIPRSLYRSHELLDILIGGDAERDVGFDLLRALTRISIAHSTVSTARALMASEGIPDAADEAASWIHAICDSVIDAASHAAPSLGVLDPPMLARLEDFSGRLLSRYATELADAPVSRRGAGDADREVVIVDPRLACDICALRAAGALVAAWRSGMRADWAEFTRWRSEGRRILNGRPRRTAHLGRLDLTGAQSWFEPNFGAAWPSCVADAEEVVRFFLTTVAGRGGSRGDPEAPSRGHGRLIDVVTPTHVVRLRAPDAAARPGQGGSPLEAAFMNDPLLTWMLFPSTGASREGCFWRDSAYGRFTSALEGIAPGEASTGLRPQLPLAGSRAVAEMAEPLIRAWREGGTWEGRPAASPRGD